MRSVEVTIGGQTPPSGPTWPANGIPPDGLTLAGAAAGGAGPTGRTALTATMSTVGAPAGLWRMYYTSATAGSQAPNLYLAADCAWAHAQNIVPWVSLKIAGGAANWAAAGSGSFDSWAQGYADELAALGAPVWVAIHHEPENDAGATPANFIAMQNRLLAIFKQAGDNIATSIILMGYREAFGAETWDTWMPDPSVVDIYGYDPYNWYATDLGNTWDEMDKYYADWQEWLASKGSTYQHLRQAVAETGYTDTAAAVADPPGTTGSGADWLLRAYGDLQSRNGAAFAYFDVDGASIGESPLRTWKCDSEPKATKLGAVFDSNPEGAFS